MRRTSSVKPKVPYDEPIDISFHFGDDGSRKAIVQTDGVQYFVERIVYDEKSSIAGSTFNSFVCLNVAEDYAEDYVKGYIGFND